MDFHNNIILCTDSYKVSHWMQYPSGTQYVYSYLEAREPVRNFSHTTFFGLQYYLMRYLQGEVVSQEKIDYADKFFSKHFAMPVFNKEGWQYILQKHKGKLPVSIKAVPEGTSVPRGNVLCTIENTDPQCYWLTNYLETLLVQLWYPCTVATLSREMKMVILNALEESGCCLDGIDFKVHDFGFRGVSSVETAALGDCAHLVNFKGTDTLVGLMLAEQYYDCDMAGYSIPASEHSTMTSWGQDREKDAYENMLDKYPKGPVSVVSDSWDINHAIRQIWGKDLRDKVMMREGMLVIRPDSGNPVTGAVKAVYSALECFGYTKNEAGYKILPPNVRIIQGDGIDLTTIEKIYHAMHKHHIAADNIIFGCGGSLLQKLHRDTCRFAFKCSSVTINRLEHDVWKNPKSDRSKASKAGKMKLIWEDGLKTVRNTEAGDDVMLEVFRNGDILYKYNLEEVRERAWIE